jgi:hypothetical protein
LDPIGWNEATNPCRRLGFVICPNIDAMRNENEGEKDESHLRLFHQEPSIIVLAGRKNADGQTIFS